MLYPKLLKTAKKGVVKNKTIPSERMTLPVQITNIALVTNDGRHHSVTNGVEADVYIVRRRWRVPGKADGRRSGRSF